jgi:hypothetical protein
VQGCVASEEGEREWVGGSLSGSGPTTGKFFKVAGQSGLLVESNTAY